MGRIQVVTTVGICELGFDEPRLSVDLDMKPTQSLSSWLQRRGRVGRAWPPVAGDRSYQTKAILDCRAELKEKRNPLLVLPCGAGKSFIACKIAQLATQRGRSIGFLTVRRALVADISERLTGFGVQHGVIMPGYSDNAHRTKVASIHTVAARDLTLDVDCLFIDEAHLYLSTEFSAVLARHSHIPRVMMTATPWKANGQGLGRIADSMVLGPSTEDLIFGGFLVPSRVFTRHVPDTSKVDVNESGEFNEGQIATVMSQPKIMGDAVKEWLYRAGGRPTIAHCVNVKHSQAVAERFMKAGVHAVAIDADTPDAERKRVFDDMCQDAPPKDHSLLLDLAGNVHRWGLPEDDREWTLADAEAASSKPRDNALTLRRCEDCFAVFRSYVPTCPECGREYVATGREIKERNEALVEYQREKKEKSIAFYQSRMTEEKKAEKLKKMIWDCADKQHKPGSLFIKYKLATAENLPEKWKPTVFGGIATIGKYRTACSQLEEVQGELLDKVFAKEQFNPTPLISSARRLYVETEAYKSKLVKMNLL